VDAVGNTLNYGLTQIITAVCSIIGITVMMFTLNVPLTFIVLIVLPFSFLVIRVIAKRSQKYFRRQQNYLGAVNGYVEEMYGGHGVVKAFGMEKKTVARFDGMNDKLYDTSWRSQLLSGMINPLVVFIANLGYVAVIVYGSYMNIKTLGVFTVGMLYAFIQYVRSFTSPINQTAQISNIIQSTVAAAERIYVFLNENEEKTPAAPLSIPKSEDIKGDIVFENVGFAYEKDAPVLKSINLVAPANSRVAIVGQTGSGKTTIVKLLMRFYDADEGRILLDGEDITRYDKMEYRKNIAMVLQDSWLFGGTVRENIRYGRLDATDAEVEDAARDAGADSFITALPNGYDTEINEESSNLSVGQKQLLSIARAMIKKSRVIIFDEATSSIDTLTERIVQDAVERITTNKTCFVIAHRLSTVIRSDLIVVMENGEIAETGTHRELLERGGLYAKIYYTQYAGQVES
jgi:ATP-binding cassette subfamily B protein